jgi:hypothetical protein
MSSLPLQPCRSGWAIQERDLQFFRRDLSKDERDWQGVMGRGGAAFRKDCLSPWRAEQEAAALRHLAREGGMRGDGRPDPLAPQLLGQQGPYLWLEPLNGIRLYDLIRLLEAVIQAGEPAEARSARQLIDRLLQRSRQRLMRLQHHLDGWQGPAGLHPYPLGRKLAGLVALLSRLLELPELEPALRQELRQISQRWRRWTCLPFRDATSKNVLVLIPALEPQKSDGERLTWLRQQLRGQPLERWEQLPMRELDFSSLLHSTVPEDDPISLLAHQRTLPYGPCTATAFSLLPNRHGVVEERAALALLVRWLRFGGRKMAYRLLHPQAWLQRFRHDDPLPYFRDLRRYGLQLDPALERRYPLLLERLEAIGMAYRRIEPRLGWSPDPTIERFPRPRQLWRESPLVRVDG